MNKSSAMHKEELPNLEGGLAQRVGKLHSAGGALGQQVLARDQLTYQ
jgi:hypothetical protein